MKKFAQRIIDLYERGLSPMDQPLLQALIDLGEHAKRIIELCDVTTLKPGARVLSIRGECDDGDEGPRETGPNAIGRIVGAMVNDHYPVGFSNGTSVLITPEELADADQYKILPDDRYTAFCQQTNGRGTIWIDSVYADSVDDAIQAAKEACADAWGYDDAERVHCLGLAQGDVTIAHWEDLFA